MKLSQLTKTYSVDTDGILLDYGDDLKVRLRPANCRAFTEFLRAELKAAAKDASELLGDIDESDALSRKAFAHAILIGWEGLDDEDGNPIPYSVETAYEMVQNDRFFASVQGMANDIAKNLDAYEARVTGK